MCLSVTEDKHWETQKDVDWQARWTDYQKTMINIPKFSGP